MRVLWIVNIVFPEALQLLFGENKPYSQSGGWLLGASEALLKERPDIDLTVVSFSNKVKELTYLQGEKIKYCLIPNGMRSYDYSKQYEKYFQSIRDHITPDIVHIHGTEFIWGLSYINACGNKNVVVSIQGLVSQIANYYDLGISKCDILKNITLRDFVKGSIFSEKRSFRKRGKNEIKLLKNVRYIIGRTSWDKTHCWDINPTAQYHLCNETLRNEFYGNDVWEYNKCNKHTIFLSQAGYIIKGLPVLLRALPLILNEYPDTQLRVGGYNLMNSSIVKETGYQRFIKKEIKKNKLSDHVVFLGNLNADEMKQEYLKSNVFVCPSSIENSSNSLGEAQILGVPCVASYVGGTPDMMMGDERNLYRFEDYKMLARKIVDVFDSQDKQTSMRDVALMRHNKTINAQTLLSIYNSILENERKK